MAERRGRQVTLTFTITSDVDDPGDRYGPAVRVPQAHRAGWAARGQTFRWQDRFYRRSIHAFPRLF